MMKIISQKFPYYPSQAERWWKDQLLHHTGLKDDSEALEALRPYVQRLSDAFTLDREGGLEGYTQDVRLRLAYGLFFFPQGFTRMSLILSEFFTKWSGKKEAKRVRALDMGCGLGASTLALALTLQKRGGGDILAVDRSRESLVLLEAIFSDLESLWPEVTLQTQVANVAGGGASVGENFDLITCCFALNEMIDPGEDVAGSWMKKTLESLSEKGVLALCEPATQECSLRLQQLRDIIVGKKWGAVLAPCLHQQACPMLQFSDVWCHQVRRWVAPDSMEYLNRRLHRNLSDLKYSYLLVGKNGVREQDPSASHTRLIAPLHEVKGRILTSGCSADGQMHAFELQTRDVSKEDKKRLLALERGDVFEWGEARRLGDGKTFRVPLPARVLFSCKR